MRNRKTARGARLYLLAGAASVALTLPAAAQVDEITVTARKKEENLQDVPASISALSQEQIERGFLQDVRDIQNFVPNVVFDEVNVGSAGNAAVSMRGVSFQDVEKSFDPAVGIMIDGFFLGSPNGSIYKTLDVERIEILRGPQGTLFGKNTIGGLIHVIRSKPTGEFGGKIKLDYGSFDRYGVDALINLPEWNGFSVKGTIGYHHHNGYFDNVVTGDTVGELDYLAYGVNARFAPSESFYIDYRYDRYEDDSDVTPLVNNSSPASASCALFSVCGTGRNNSDSAFGGRYNVGSTVDYNLSFFNNTTHILTSELDLSEDFSVKYIGGYQKTDEDITNNFGGFNAPDGDVFFAGRRPQTYKQYSNELTIFGDLSSTLSFVAGGYQWHAEYMMAQDFFLNPLLGGIPGTPGVDPLTSIDLRQDTRHNTNSWSAYGEINFDVTDKLEVTAGARYIVEEKAICSRFAVPLSLYGGSDFVLFDSCDNPAATDLAALGLTGATLTRYLAGFRPNDEWKDSIWKGSVKYDWTDTFNTWFTYSTGFRSGGFNGRGQSFASASTPYDPEKVHSYEAGFHSQFADNRVQVNGAYFYTSYRDLQLDSNIASPLGSGQETIVNNAARAKVQGIEIDAVLAPTDWWTFGGSFGWLDAEYKEFLADLRGLGIEDNSGLKLRRAPKFSFSVNSVMERDIGEGKGSLRVNYGWKDEYETALANNPFATIESYGILDASVSFDWRSYSLSVYGRNLTDENYFTHAFPVPLNESLWNFGVPREPRVWGVELTAAW
jgi:iron complex outermembrane receptor protein